MNTPKILYHSELLKAHAKGNANSPFSITILEEAHKFGNHNVATVMYAGEKRDYVLDNAGVADFFSGQKGRTMSIIAEGGKGDEVLTYIGEAVPEDAPRGRMTRKPPVSMKARSKQSGTKPPPGDSKTDEPEAAASHEKKPAESRTVSAADPVEFYRHHIKETKAFLGRQRNLALLCASAADSAAEEYKATHGQAWSAERVHGVTMAMFIESNRNGFGKSLPTGEMSKYVPNAPKATPP